MRERLGLLLWIAGCAGVSQATSLTGAEARYGDEWMAARGQGLRLTPEAARARDAAFSDENVPPDSFWDEQMQMEAAVLWRDLCARCHGPHGDPDEAQQKFERNGPRSWTGMGPSMGFFFGGDEMRGGIFRRIRDGGDEDGNPSAMAAWGSTLSNEQIWGLVRHIEGF